MGSLPTRFWVTMGYGLHSEHPINAYDQALFRAGLCNQNMRMLSSVPPDTLIKPIIKNGTTFVPLPATTYEAQKILSKGFRSVRIRHGSCLKTCVVLGTAWMVDLVLARSDGGQFERVTSSIGLGYYTAPNGHGIYAVEDDGHKDVDGSIDNCSEMLRRMVDMRHKEFVRERGHKGECIKSIPLRTVTSPIDKKTKLDVRQVIWHCHNPKMEVHTISIDKIPEGCVGSVISAAVMDPFTEIH